MDPLGWKSERNTMKNNTEVTTTGGSFGGGDYFCDNITILRPTLGALPLPLPCRKCRRAMELQ